MPHSVGYCCINTTLQKQKITTGRGMIQRTFKQKGLTYASELALKNSEDLIKILQWNANHNVKVFRMGSGIFPWGTEYKATSLPDYFQIISNLEKAGNFAKQTGQRITCHPDHFVKLASTKETVVQNSIKDLELHAEVFDYMGLDKTPYAAMNIHVGMNFSEETAARWVKSFKRLSHSCQSRMTVENDDKASGFSVMQLFSNVYAETGTPITFDYFHHEFHQDGLTTQEAAELAAGTWPENITPLFHYSESKNLNENVKGNPRAHADYVFNPINDFELTLDIDLEAKAKELALFKYRELL
jgi:UV DNA damage endonuclease